MNKNNRADEILTLLFMLLAVAAGICYFTAGANRLPFYICGGLAIAIRIVQYIVRIFH